MATIRDYQLTKSSAEVGGSDYGIPSLAESSYGGEYDYETDIDFPVYDLGESESWEEEYSYAQLAQQQEQFIQEMELSKEKYGFDKEKFQYLSGDQKRPFAFNVKIWKYEKEKWERQFKFEQDRWEDLKVQFEKRLKQRPPPVWGI